MSVDRRRLGFLSRLFGSVTTTVTETYTITDAPPVPTTMLARSTEFEPDVLAVEYRNGRFRHLRVSGPAVGHPSIRVTRHYDRLAEVPEWARGYTSTVRAEATR
ncbi:MULTISPECIES: hypothetical protein [unclassified Micromonospora]|uniref:hypothetical protein n=1 Tax=unclassified Micromonospora TaxID=2617518 RepID=UPI00331C767E